MRKVSSRRFAGALGALALAGALCAAPATAQAQPPAQPEWKPEKLTNLKVLPKDTTPEQIMAIMKHYTASLGAGCVMCHKGQVGQPYSTFDFADDGKENKEVTREMIRMTMEINTKYPDALPSASATEPAVTCATCHRRNRHPETEPPPPPPKPAGAQVPPGAPQPAAPPAAPAPPR